MGKSSTLSLFFFLMLIAGFAVAQQDMQISENIRLNQLGFYPEGQKIIVLKALKAENYMILNEKQQVAFKGKFQESENPGLDGKHTFIADFSAFTKPGRFTFVANGIGRSHPFNIQSNVYQDLAKASIKAFYYQRASIELKEKYAGIWHRSAGHPDNKVLIHASAASPGRPEGTIIAAAGGWYDAGDYNKYIVNSGITMGTLLSLYEDFPQGMDKSQLNIPESNNPVPDLLNELIYNLRWMLAMQDPADGGVYNKLTNVNFDGMVMPSEAIQPRYVVQKGSAATLDFAAVMAQSARILKRYNQVLPGLGDSCLKASLKAWQWAQKNPAVVYNQNENNKKYKPQITTGGYGDTNFTDEWIWAAIELYITTNEAQYATAVPLFPDDTMPLPGWNQVKLMGYYSLLRNEKTLGPKGTEVLPRIKAQVLKLAARYVNGVNSTAYQTVMGKNPRDFGWGSNSGAANQGILLLQAYHINGDKNFLNAAMGNLDYLLGRNAAGYSYVTGFGYKTPMFPHHRQSSADGIKAPVPGLLVGGANPGMQDGVALSSKIPDEAYTDVQGSFATNEIAINWNAPFAYLVNALNILHATHK